jgi:hypothetical protein
MASTISDNLSTLDSEQLDDREAIQDAELESIDSSAPSSHKRPRELKNTKLWSYSRKPKDNEPAKNRWSQRIWYCGQNTRLKQIPCGWSLTNGERCQDHLHQKHNIVVIEG